MLELIAYGLDWVVRLVNITAFSLALFAFVHRQIRRRTVQRFFGGRTVTTYFPMRNLNGRSAIDEADLAATRLLDGFLRRYGIRMQQEFIREDGHVDLDRDGLIVICGPKTSELIRRTMERDDAVSFTSDGEHWHLTDHDTGTAYYSPRDIRGENADVGYLSRAERSRVSPRTFLSIAGIHSQGSAIVVHHLCHYPVVKRLYKDFKREPFSAIMSGGYESEPLTIVDTEEVVSRQRGTKSRGGSRYAVTRADGEAPTAG